MSPVLEIVFSDFETEVRDYCKEPSTAALPQATIMRWANLLQLDFCKRTLILRGIATATSVANRSAYGPFNEALGNPDLVTYLLAEVLYGEVIYGEDVYGGFSGTLKEGTRLGPTTRRQLYQENDEWWKDTGTPEAYFWEGNILNLYPPAPNTGDSVKIFFPIVPQKITAEGDSFDIDTAYIEAILHGVANRVFAKRGKAAQARDEMAMYEHLVEEAKGDVDTNTPEEVLRFVNISEFYD